VAALRGVFLDVVSADAMRRLAGKLLEQALAGDTAAAKLVLEHALGRPAEAVNPDALDLDEVRLLLRLPHKTELVLHGMEAVDGLTALVYLQSTATTEPRKVLDGFQADEDDLDDLLGEGPPPGLVRLLKLRDKVLAARAKQT
jgi:hypothetical protein